MANEIEIVVTTKYEPGQGLAQAAQRTRSEATQIAADIERIFDRSAASVASAFDSTASKINADLKGIKDQDVTVDINVDDQKIRKAEGDIRDLDSIPPPTITPDANAKPAVDKIQDTLGNIDVSNVSGQIVDQLGSKLSAGGPLGAVALGVGALFADNIADGFNRGFSAANTNLNTQIQTGFGAERSSAIGKAAGDAYGAGFGESAGAALDASIILERRLGDLDPSLNLREASKWALTLADQFGIDIPQQAELAGRMIQQGLAENTEDAYNQMIDAGQRYGAQTEEVLDAVREFGGVFDKLGISGPAAIRLIGDTYESGLTSQVERAAEAMEELNTRITDQDSKEAIESLGLSFTDVQTRIAAGGEIAASAVRDVAQAIIEQKNEAEKGAAANTIFGTSFEVTADIDAFAGAILEASTAQHDLAGTSREVAELVSESQTEWEKAGRTIESVAKTAGGVAATEFNKYADALGSVLDVGDKVGNFFQDFQIGAGEATTASGELTGVTKALADSFPAATDAMEDGADAADSVSDATKRAIDPFNELESAIDRAKGALDKWADDTGEQAIISLRESTLGLTEAFDENTTSSFSLKDGWDLNTEAGIKGAKATLDFKGEVADLRQAQLDAKISSGEFTSELANAEAGLRAALGQTNLTEAAIEALIQDMLNVPDVDPELNASGDLFDKISQAHSQLNNLDGKTASVFINTYEVTYRGTSRLRGSTAGGSGQAAGGSTINQDPGGPSTAGVPSLVNEGGQEAVRLPQGDIVPLPVGGSVLTAPDTERLVGSSGRGGPSLEVNVTVMGSVWSSRDLAETIRDEIYTGGFDGLGGVNS